MPAGVPGGAIRGVAGMDGDLDRIKAAPAVDDAGAAPIVDGPGIEGATRKVRPEFGHHRKQGCSFTWPTAGSREIVAADGNWRDINSPVTLRRMAV